MRQSQIVLPLVFFGFVGFSCGKGADALALLGVCDGYPNSATSEYHLPWSTGVTRTVSQGNCSGVSHYAMSRYAYDIPMDIGSNVVAVRAGTVVGVKEDMTDGNGCPYHNYVHVRHSDGTVAQYIHLTTGGALVAVGDAVTQDQVIASSGNTGCSTGPHLHFQVVSAEGSSETIPITFSNTSNNSHGLISGASYIPQ